MRKSLVLSLLLSVCPVHAEDAAPGASPSRDQLQAIAAMPAQSQGAAMDGDTRTGVVVADAGPYVPPPSTYVPPPPGYVPPPAYPGYNPYLPPPPGYWRPYRPYHPVFDRTRLIVAGTVGVVAGAALLASAAPVAGALFLALGIGLLIAGLTRKE